MSQELTLSHQFKKIQQTCDVHPQLNTPLQASILRTTIQYNLADESRCRHVVIP